MPITQFVNDLKSRLQYNSNQLFITRYDLSHAAAVHYDRIQEELARFPNWNYDTLRFSCTYKYQDRTGPLAITDP
jgi:hypothetical protein